MIINSNNYSIAEIVGMLNRRELQVNNEYQRGSRLWPNGARSYFIDTILEKFPFPKLYFYEVYDRIRGEVHRELVDGQQRISTIQDFINGVFAISGESQFRGMHFADLDDDQTADFMGYSVSVDVIRNASRGEILQMFRRMNAYTLPLNEAEKRHSMYQGDFKWFTNNLADELSEFFSDYGVFTNRQILRMADAELISELALTMERGIISTTPKELRAIYRQNENNGFPDAAAFHEHITGAVREVTNYRELVHSHLMKPYALHILVVAIIHLHDRIPALEGQLSLQEPDRVGIASPQAEADLGSLAHAHEINEIEGPHSEYVWGCQAGTNRAGRRLARLKGILEALGNPVVVVEDQGLANLLP